MSTPLGLSPPTDNLYKFIGIFGLSIILFFTGLVSVEVRDIETKIGGLESEMAVLLVDTRQLQPAQVGSERYWDLQRRSAVYRVKVAQVKRLNRRSERDLQNCWAALIVGGVMWLIGGWNWIQFQRRQDELLRLQVEAAKANLDKQADANKG